ncbi:MAG: hypothetical protein K0S33_2978 [Bacteroidetes bacterium]|jgi:hypothetical protein|nr:hypothetical protein [Bacteroidota bacterium]
MLRPLTLVIVLCILLAHDRVSAQYFNSPTAWKKYRNEIYFGGGVGNFLGDLGGRDKVGKDYSYADLELSLTRPSATFGYRYRLAKNFGWRTDFNYMRLWGKDALTQERFRHNRNLSFRTNIYEISTNLEFVLNISKGGNMYHIKNTRKRRFKSSNHYIYLFGGIGAFYFNPKAQFGNNWYALQPLSTEGQGLPNGPGKYYRFSISLPFGAGYRYSISREWTIGIEYNFRKTFTDYIDDVHGSYYDPATLYQQKGAVAVALADPSLGLIPNATAPNGDGSGAQRGDKQMDSYLSLEVKIGYMLKTKKRKKTRAKF